MQLHQVLALEKAARARIYRAVTDLHHQLVSNNPRLAGISRTYKPKDEDGDRLPSESTLVQLRANDGLAKIREQLVELFDITFTKDFANQSAAADIKVDGTTLAVDVPVTYLLFLEKQLVDLATILAKLPVLDPAEAWTWDATRAAYTASSETTRTKKVPRNHVKAEATDKHPAQVETYYEDQIVGYWTTTKLSGALPQDEVDELKARVVKLQNAVKVAREEANNLTVTNRTIGAAVFGYLYGTVPA